MRLAIKIGIVAGAGLGVWWLLRKSPPTMIQTAKGATGTVDSISVTKTSSECDPASPLYNADACTAIGDQTPGNPSSNDGPAPLVLSTYYPPGSDGPITPRLQRVNGLGSMIQQPLSGLLTSSRRG